MAAAAFTFAAWAGIAPRSGKDGEEGTPRATRDLFSAAHLDVTALSFVGAALRKGFELEMTSASDRAAAGQHA